MRSVMLCGFAAIRSTAVFNGRLTGLLSLIMQRPPERILRLFFFCCALGLGGCGASELARQDQEVRASWQAVLAADRVNIALATRLAAIWRTAPEQEGTGSDEPQEAMARMLEERWSDAPSAGNEQRMLEYAGLRARLIAHMTKISEMLSAPASANLAWRLRGLRKECLAALMRANATAQIYNEAARVYNRELNSRTGNVSRALLYPQMRQFALLQAGAPE
jgi:hypothetical protein